MAAGKKEGPWQGREARDFKDFQKAIRDVVEQQDPHTKWVVEIEVKKNPVHDYRIILNPRP